MRLRYCIVGLLLHLACALTAQAQTSIVVRLAAEAPEALRAALRTEGASKQALDPQLFEGVTAVSPVFPAPAAGKRDPSPFQAFTLTAADEDAALALLAAWAGQPGVAYAQPNHAYRLDAAPLVRDDPFLDSLAHLSVIHAMAAWRVTAGVSDVRLGLIDTGLFFEHPDLAAQVAVHAGEDANGNGRVDASDFNGRDDDGNGYVDDLRGYDFVDRTTSVELGDYQTRDSDPSEDDEMGGGRGHGTLVAGVAAAARDNDEGIVGVAPGVRIVPLRAFGADGIGEDDDVAAAIVYGALLGLDVINLSFGDVYYSRLMREAIQFAVAQGTIVVASAGNLGGDDPHYPSDYPEVVSAAWLTEDGGSIAGRGTFGIGIDVGAPGSFVYTTLMPRFEDDGSFDPSDLYGRRSGSSVAAPMVAAAAALLRSLDPALSPAAVRSILTATAADLREPGWDHRTGAGLLDVEAALLRALPGRVALTVPDHDSGWAQDQIPLVGSVADPSFASFSLSFAAGDGDPDGAWQLIAGPFQEQVLNDTLAVWPVAGLPEGVYTLRLAATLRTGRTIEDRRRVFLDRTSPILQTHIFGAALVAGRHGLTLDLETDDLTDAELTVSLDGRSETITSDRRARRHGVTWVDETGRGGLAEVRLQAHNRAGLASVQTTHFVIPERRSNTALFEEAEMEVPHGYLLPQATDFDADGLLEIVMNQFQDGWIGDTLAVREWDGKGFRLVHQVVANVIPRDVGDPNEDGRLDLLTQVGGATLMLAQRDPSGYPVDPSFVDTTGLTNPFDPNAAFGARLTDLDGDGLAEILVHNTKQWRLLEYDGNGFAEVLRLDNPTAASNTEVTQNEFQQPLVLVGDFDNDSRTDLLTGDGDGDWVMYEARGDNRLEAVWTYETDRYNAGARFGIGDFDGDGLAEFVTYTQNWVQPTSAGEREPDVGRYYVWDQRGDDTYALVDSFAIPGLLSRHGAMAAADFDGDGRDELVVVDAPDLYVFGFDGQMRRTLWFHRGAAGGPAGGGYRSISLLTADFDADGRPELLAAGADERLHRLVFGAAAQGAPPPVWEAAAARDTGHVDLAWRAEQADSVAVYGGGPSAPFDLLWTTTASTFTHATTQATRYGLRAWRHGALSPLGEVRVVTPRNRAVVDAVAYPEPNAVELLFSEPMAPGLRAEQFRLDAAGEASSVLAARSGRAVLVRFETIAERSDTLRWSGVRDATGRSVGQAAAAVAFPEATPAVLHLTRWDVEGSERVLLQFNLPLDSSAAMDVGSYSLRPAGQVVEARWQAERPAEVRLQIAGRVIGATGLETSLVVERMRGAQGETLADAGTAVSLVQAATDLEGVYVFPNPYRAAVHEERVMVAGLPAEATITILSVQGVLVRRLEERRGMGGVAWDLRDTDGRLVPSGVYLVRVEAAERRAVLRKVAVVR